MTRDEILATRPKAPPPPAPPLPRGLEGRIAELEDRLEALELLLRRSSLMVARYVEEHRDLTSR